MYARDIVCFLSSRDLVSYRKGKRVSLDTSGNRSVNVWGYTCRAGISSEEETSVVHGHRTFVSHHGLPRLAVPLGGDAVLRLGGCSVSYP